MRRWEQIKRFIHASPIVEEIPQERWFEKMQPLADQVQSNFQRWVILGRFTLQLCDNYRSNHRVVLLHKRPKRANYPQLSKELPGSGPPQNHLSPLSIIMSIITIFGAKDKTG
jgi:hypothetical protein